MVCFPIVVDSILRDCHWFDSAYTLNFFETCAHREREWEKGRETRHWCQMFSCTYIWDLLVIAEGGERETDRARGVHRKRETVYVRERQTSTHTHTLALTDALEEKSRNMHTHTHTHTSTHTHTHTHKTCFPRYAQPTGEVQVLVTWLDLLTLDFVRSPVSVVSRVNFKLVTRIQTHAKILKLLVDQSLISKKELDLFFWPLLTYWVEQHNGRLNNCHL